MQLSHQLVPKLKSLRLSGILETLDVRNQQAIDGMELPRFRRYVSACLFLNLQLCRFELCG